MKNLKKLLTVSLLFSGLRLSSENLENSKNKQAQLSEFIKNNKQIQTFLKFAKDHKGIIISNLITALVTAYLTYGFFTAPEIVYKWEKVDDETGELKNVGEMNVPAYKRILCSPLVPLVRFFKLYDSPFIKKIFDSGDYEVSWTVVFSEPTTK